MSSPTTSRPDSPFAPGSSGSATYRSSYGSSYDGPLGYQEDGTTWLGSAPATPPAPPAPAPARSRKVATGALLLALCLGSGAAGAGAVHLLDGDGPTGNGSVATTTTLRSGGAPVTAPAGTAQAAAATISPSVVTIAVTGREQVTTPFGRTANQRVSGTGSGIVLDTDGYIVTNNHVVSAATNGGSVSVTFSDGSTVPARIVGTDPTSDLAVVQVQGVSGLKPATFADSSTVAVGQAVLAVGAPLGLSNTVTEGIISTLDRPVRTGEAGATEQSVIDALQTDAAINPGNSGGALVDLAGAVIGVNSAIATTGDSSSGGQSGNIGVGFAIPANTVTKVADQLIKTGSAVHPLLGVSAGDAAGEATGTPGAGAVVQVSPGGAAAQAGLQNGDIITKVDDRKVTDADSLIVAVRAHDPGDTVNVTYLRGGQEQTAKATLTQAPTS